MFRWLMPAVLVVAACSEEPRLNGEVVDIWGNPIEGATVVMEGQSERPLTDHTGRFSLPLAAGKHKMKAGREGYIQEHQEVEVPADVTAETAPKVIFKLYKKPEEAGFYVVDTNDYVRLEPALVGMVGNELQRFRGLTSVGENSVQGTQIRVLFHTPLKLDQVMRLGMQLHHLDYVSQAKMVGPIEEAMVDVKLWTSQDIVPIEITPLRSRNDYLITSADGLAAGGYAFDTQGMLSGASDDSFHEIPEPLRVAYPIELR